MNHIFFIKPSKKFTFAQAVISNLYKGLTLMNELEVPRQYMLSLKELQIMASIGPKGRIRTFMEVMYVIEIVLGLK